MCYTYLVVWGSTYPQAPCLLLIMFFIFSSRREAMTLSLLLAAVMRWSHILSSSLRSSNVWAHWVSKSACFRTSSARILFRMNSASFATLTIWSFMAWDRRRPSLINSMKASPACFCKEFCHSWEHSSMTNSTTLVLLLKVVSPEMNGKSYRSPYLKFNVN